MNLNIQNILKTFKTRKPHASLIATSIWNTEINDFIKDASARELTSVKKSKGSQPVSLIRAALHLWNDDIHSAHEIVQSLENPTAYYIHAILHRREPDYSNSKYWLARLPSHPNYSLIKEKYSDWDPVSFVDWCETAESQQDPNKMTWLCEVQAYELELLVDFCLG